MRKREDDFPDYREPPDEFRPIMPPRFLPHCVFVLVVLFGALAAVHFFCGPLVLQQMLHSLLAPVGLVWLALLLALYWVSVWRIRLGVVLCGLAWLGLTLAGNSLVSNRLVRTLETAYTKIDPFQSDQLDVVLVLGGGTDGAPNGTAQLGAAGDRLALAARLYHAGKVNRIVVSGLRESTHDNQQPHYAESAKILRDLDVPVEHIVELPAGTDTASEMAAFKEWLAENSTEPVGVVTSAWHMKRAMILAKRNQINARPIPANFLSGSDRFHVAQVIPTAWNLYVSQLAVKELLGRWLDR